MTVHQGNGQAREYEVIVSGQTRSAIKKCQREAIQAGRGKAFLAAFRTVIARLHRDPLGFGEILYHLPALKLVVCQGGCTFIIVDFGVHEEQPIVFLRGMKLLL